MMLPGVTYFRIFVDNRVSCDTCMAQVTTVTGEWTFPAIALKRKNGDYSVKTFVQKVVKTELIH